MKFHPLRALRPTADLARAVSSPPYDVINSEEAGALAEGNPASFLHVTRPEICLPSDVDVHSDPVYEEAGKQLRRLRDEGVLVQDETPALWLYRLIMDGRSQVGIVGCCDVVDYLDGRIRKHEHTRPDKEDDRTRHMDETNANAGPVFLACRAHDGLTALQESWMESNDPEFDLVGYGDVRHTLWRISDPDELERAASVYAEIPCFYIADGHHRAASAGRVYKMRKAQHPNDDGSANWNRFLNVVFPHDQLDIMAYNRVVADLNGRQEAQFLVEVAERFEVSAPGTGPLPPTRHHFGMYLGGSWRQLKARDAIVNNADPVACLDVAILQDNLLGPLLNIEDPRTNQRIQFVGGIRGAAELERLVDARGEGVAFFMYPTAITELFAVADADQVMPPKSTWFEPKLASGLIVHPLG